jgi:hypothetical protein
MWIMVTTKNLKGEKQKARRTSALCYELCSYLRTRRADYEPYSLKNVGRVVRGVITRMPFSLLLYCNACNFTSQEKADASLETSALLSALLAQG